MTIYLVAAVNVVETYSLLQYQSSQNGIKSKHSALQVPLLRTFVGLGVICGVAGAAAVEEFR